MHFSDHDRIALFIDGPNFYACAKSIGLDIDYKNLLQTFRSEGRLVRAYYYTTVAEDQEYSTIRPLIDWLGYNGYTMSTKPAREYVDATGRRRFRGSMSIELAVDMMEIAPNIDHAVLFSGDGDFRHLVKAVQRSGVRVTVISSLRGQSPMVADELRRQADDFVELHDLINDFGHDFGHDDIQADIPSFVRKPAIPSPTPTNPGPDVDDDDIYEDA